MQPVHLSGMILKLLVMPSLCGARSSETVILMSPVYRQPRLTAMNREKVLKTRPQQGIIQEQRYFP
jgi:hypothetical protein